ncbi:MAG: FtsX-like permease family protein [Thermoanaerobaculia bacterium]
MTYAGYVLRHLRARPLRATLTAGAFAFSIGLLGFLWLLSTALQKEWSPYMAQRLIVTAKTSFFDKLPMAYLAKIEATPGVARVAPFDVVLASYRDNRPENVVGVSSAVAGPTLEIYREANVPPEQAKAWTDDPTGALVGPVLAEKLGWKLGDRVVLKAPVKGGVIETTIRAEMGYRLDSGLYLHRRYFEQLTGDEGSTNMFWVLAKTRGDVDRITASLNREFENAPVPARAMTERQWQLQFMEMLGNVQALLGSLGLATGFALLLITANSLAMSARERKGEAAVLRVLGFRRKAIAGFLLGEALVYGVAGAILGGAVMAAFAHFVGAALDKTQYAGMGGLLVPDATALLLAAAASVGLAVLAGAAPALNLARRPIAELLREG